MESVTGLHSTGPSLTTTDFPSLPTEIWQLIFSFGESDEDGSFFSAYDNATMASICRVCTMFRDLIRPTLYRNFDSHVQFPDKWHWLSVGKYARTICENPDLCSLVRRVDIRGLVDMHMFCGRPNQVALGDPEHPLTTVLMPRADELGLYFKYYKMYSEKRTGHELSGFIGFDLVTLILAQLPMLRTLKLYWFDSADMPDIPHPRGGWPWAHSIRKMVLRPCSVLNPVEHHLLGNKMDSTHGYSVNALMPLVCGGTGLTSLSLINSMGPEFTAPLQNLSEVILQNCQFQSGDLAHMLQHCKYLRKFVYRASIYAIPLTSTEFVEALEPAYSTLEVLGIHINRQDYHNGPRIESLKDFTALKTLYIDFNCIWDLDVDNNLDDPPRPDMLFTTLLPESIEEVTVVAGDSNYGFQHFWVEPHLIGLAAEKWKRGIFPHLRRIRGEGLSPLDWQTSDPRVIERRMAKMNEAKRQFVYDGVEVAFDRKGESDVDFLEVIWGY